jgi:A/G-specific adenine glycosylase
VEPVRISHQKVTAFRRKILAFYRQHGRSLPFRETRDPYAITVAELMLQQTQVERVVDKYQRWLRRWPTWEALAHASRQELLEAWSGLGYNRRAIYLGQMACQIVERFGGKTPSSPAVLKTLPGIGDYTANAIAIFAFNSPCVTIDTNIRKVLVHEFGLDPNTPRSDLEELARRLLPPRRARDWHNALMDYARVALRKDLDYIAPLTTQNRFEGSRRQIRGAIVRALTTAKRVSISKIAAQTARSVDDVREAALTLQKDGLVVVTPKFIRLA